MLVGELMAEGLGLRVWGSSMFMLLGEGQIFACLSVQSRVRSGH